MKLNPNRVPTKSKIKAVEFISRKFETYVAERENPDNKKKYKKNEPHFNVVIVGSGYGGAIAASEFSSMKKAGANSPLSVCVLERGIERLPGSFPSTLAQLPTEVRFFGHTANETPLNDTSKVYGNRSGLFDVRMGDGQSALVGNGLGGGSLINAGVMLQPAKSVFEDPVWPAAIRNDNNLNGTFKESLEKVGATVGNKGEAYDDSPITIDLLPAKLKKFEALNRLGASENGAQAVPITVKLSGDVSNQTVASNTCIQCGDCFSGCNHNAKRSLDTNLLAEAAVAGAKLYCGATVLSFDKLDSGLWELTCTYTDESMQKHLAEHVKIRCEKLVIAAGTLGSTELLLRSQKHTQSGMQFSEQLGEHFSGNGDMIANISDNTQTINSVASETVPPVDRKVGPTITGMIDLRDSETPAVVQELAVPAMLRRLLIQTTSFTQTISALTSPQKARVDFSEPFSTINPMGPVGPGDDASYDDVKRLRDPEADHLAILAVMGQDNLSGNLFLPEKAHKNRFAPQGTLAIKFPSSPAKSTPDHSKAIEKNSDSTFYDKNMERLEQLLEKSDPGAWLHANPLWKPLGKVLENMFGANGQAMQITVHPLGGCAMGDSPKEGVVNSNGEVFDPNSTDATGVHEGLVVLDGSIIPKALGVNPALTISALSLRATRELARLWQLETSTSSTLDKGIKIAKKRPAIKSIPIDTVREKTPTEVELVERLTGAITLKTPEGRLLPCMVELRLRSEPFEIAKFSRFEKRAIPLSNEKRPDVNNTLPDRSYLRIFSKEVWDKHHDIREIMSHRDQNGNSWASEKRNFQDNYDSFLDELALVKAPLTGHVQLLEETPSNYQLRVAKGFWSWFMNRGIRDFIQSLKASLFKSGDSQGISTYFSWQTVAAFANTGRQRHLSYHLTIGETDTHACLEGLSFEGRNIDGKKTFAYRRRTNPWRQLMDINISNFPFMYRPHKKTLRVDPGFFARTQVPLFHIVGEDNAVDGYADLVDFYGHMARVFAMHQLWTLRKPDTPPDPPEIDKYNGIARKRLPEDLAGIESEYYSLPINGWTEPADPAITPIQAGLTQYKQSENKVTLPPVLCIHGYSASGSTYAHNSLYGGRGKKGGLVRHLHDKGHEVWVLDMRSSSAFSCAQIPWNFEHMAFNDIPRAINKVCEVSGAEKVDIVAHCMGAAMLSMTLLGDSSKGSVEVQEHEKPELKKARLSVNRIVLSQAGPFFKFTPMNTMRAWVLGFIKELLPRDGFSFNPKSEASEWETIMDRLLNTLPYPDTSEFDRVNPIIGDKPWVRTRHRMDALYGKTFSLSSMSDEILDHIDEYFGPFSFQTLEQTLPISARGQISSRYGTGFEISNKKLNKLWTYPTLWIHGEENGLIDPCSPSLTALRFDEAGNKNLNVKIISNRGHQDCLMGQDCSEPFDAIAEHFRGNRADNEVQHA